MSNYLKMAKAALDAAESAEGEEFDKQMASYAKYMKLAQASKDLDSASVEDELPEEGSDPDVEESETPVAEKKTATKTARPPFAAKLGADKEPEGEEVTARARLEWAAKTLHVAKFGDQNAAFDQIGKELYGDVGGYYAASALKKADFRRYLKYGEGEGSKMAQMVVLSEKQIAEAVIEGVSIGEMKATMVEAQDTLGGYLVPEDFQQGEIISRLPSITVVRPRATVRQTTRDVYSVATRTGGNSQFIGNVRVYAVDESPTGSQSLTNATFGKVAIPINTLMANVPVSLNVLEDAGVDLASELAEEFALARAIQEDNWFLTGLGGAQPQGILQGNTTGGPSSPLSVVVESGSATTIPSGDVIKNIPYNLDFQYRQMNPVWVGSKSTRRVIATLKDSTGDYLWADRNQQLERGQIGKLEGYEFVESEILPSTTATNGVAYTSGVYPLVFGDMKGYRVVDRIGMSVTRYVDSTTAVQNQAIFVMRWRGGGQVTNGYQFVVLKLA